MSEVWKAVAGYEGRYEISSLGRVRSLPNSRRSTPLILKPSIAKRGGYLVVRLTSNVTGKWCQASFKVHRLVLDTFVGADPLDRPFGLHRDGNPLNAALSNLYWGTQRENMEDRRRHGRGNIGSRNPRSTLSEAQVIEIKDRLKHRKRGDIARLARELGLNYRTVSAIASGANWSSI